MSLKQIKYQEKTELNLFIENVNKLIFNGELTDIIEVTYAYSDIGDGFSYNKTLFDDFGGFNYEDITSENKIDFLQKVKQVVKDKLSGKIELIDNFLFELANVKINSEIDSITRELLSGSLKYARNTLEMALCGLGFELEKAGLAHDYSSEKVKQKLSILHDLETANFGGKISDNTGESKLAYEYLRNRFERLKDKLSPLEQDIYKNKYLSEVEKYLDEDYVYIPKEVKNKNEQDNILDKLIPREKYIFILKTVFEILNLDFAIIEDERSSIYDGPTALHIPTSKKYDFLTIRRVIELIGHEIESHSVNLKNNEILVGKFRGAGNLIKEEGLAIVVEQLLNGVSLNNVEIPQHFSKVLMSELFDGNDLKVFLDLQNKIEEDNSHDGRFLRLKRLYPVNYKGGQHKDASYGRGVIEVVNYLNKGGDIRDLYLGKVSITDIPKVKRLMELKGISYNDLNLPLFIGELVLFLYEAEDNNKNSRNKIEISQNNFIKRLRYKYPFIDFDSIEIPVASFFTKKKVLDIIKTFREI